MRAVSKEEVLANPSCRGYCQTICLIWVAMSNKTYDVISFFSPALCRAARGLVGWSQSELAEKARVGRSTVADFERGSRTPVYNNMAAMMDALVAEGIEFIPENGGGAGVRFRERRS
jgi:DNA-binding XRE family transcriptional regulator